MSAISDPGVLQHLGPPRKLTITEFKQGLMLTRSLEDFGYAKRDLIAEGRWNVSTTE